MSALMSRNKECQAGFKTTHEKASCYISRIKRILDGDETIEEKLNQVSLDISVLYDLMKVREKDW